MRVEQEEPRAAVIFGVGLAMISASFFSSFLTQTWSASYSSRPQPLATWLLTMIYLDSFVFTAVASALGYGVANLEMTHVLCKITDVVCLTLFLSTKVIYLFLVEKACTIHGRSKPRLQSKMWLLNMMGMLVFYILILVFEFLNRFTSVTSGVCVIHGNSEVLIGLIIWDIGAKVYLLSLFLVPIWNWVFMRRLAPSSKVRRTTIRMSVGLVCLLAAAAVNAIVISLFRTQPMWICILSCNCDVLFASAVIHWTSLRDETETIPPPIETSNIEYAVDNSHPNARSQRFTMVVQPPPHEWLHPGHLLPPASGQSLIGMLSDEDDKELRFAHHRSLLEIERRSIKGGPSVSGRAMIGRGSASKLAAQESRDPEMEGMMSVAHDAVPESSSSGKRAAACGSDRAKSTGAVTIDGIADVDRSDAGDISLAREAGRKSRWWGKRVKTYIKDGVRSRNESADKQPPSL